VSGLWLSEVGVGEGRGGERDGWYVGGIGQEVTADLT
jgi:hypothetical protein